MAEKVAGKTNDLEKITSNKAVGTQYLRENQMTVPPESLMGMAKGVLDCLDEAARAPLMGQTPQEALTTHKQALVAMSRLKDEALRVKTVDWGQACTNLRELDRGLDSGQGAGVLALRTSILLKLALVNKATV